MCDGCNGAFGVCDCRTCTGDAILTGCGVEFQLIPGDGETAFCLSCAEKRNALDEPDRYRVVNSWGDVQDFPSFDDARATWARTPGSDLLNMKYYDGSSDGNHSGLTRAEKDLLGLE